MTMRWPKTPLRLLAVISAGLFFSGPAFAKGEVDAAGVAAARVAVATAMDQVLAALSDEALDRQQRRDRIQKVAYRNFDFYTMSKLVLRRDWKKFSKAQRDEFVEEFKLHLSKSYGTRLERYDQEAVAIVGERAEVRGDVTIKTEVRGGQFHGAEVDYRMRNRKGKWLAIDVIIEGVSLVANFHSQFEGIVSRDGPEELLAQLRQKNANGEITEFPSPKSR